MLTLTLLRHAKSSWDDPELGDFDRPLAPRGETAAPRIGAAMVAAKLKPDLVVCSSALRTRQTLALVMVEFAKPMRDIVYEDDIYLATASSLLTRLRTVKRQATHIMLVGHNPGLHALALELVGDGRRKQIVAMARKFPTGGLAVIDFEDAESWTDVRAAGGALRLFVTPRALD
jgi:phosphohistidine phosphatase